MNLIVFSSSKRRIMEERETSEREFLIYVQVIRTCDGVFGWWWSLLEISQETRRKRYHS